MSIAHKIFWKNIKSIKTAKDLRGKRVLLRLDLNVPMERGRIVDATRIEKSLSTIKFLRKQRARTIIMSHLGDDSVSLKEIARYLNKFIPVGFIPQIIGKKVEKTISTMQEGSVLVLENLRGEKGEVSNNPFFAMSLSRLGDIYVNDAFSVSHRNHASIVSLPKFLPSFTGIQFEEEIRELSRVFTPKHPFMFILGGAKLETKLPLIKKYLKIADIVYVGGALMNPFFNAMGYEVGKSLKENAGEDLKKLTHHKNLILPTDVLVSKGEVRKLNGIKKNDIVRDIGPESLRTLLSLIKESKEILFNGPLGEYELGFDETTKEILKAMAKTKARTVLGGGDTLAIVSRLKLESKFSFVSTAGGAMIEFLLEGTLSGIEALKGSKK
ncbi:MAG: phosphoglycerate kinase [Patescibacteria group bacterium]